MAQPDSSKQLCETGYLCTSAPPEHVLPTAPTQVLRGPHACVGGGCLAGDATRRLPLSPLSHLHPIQSSPSPSPSTITCSSRAKMAVNTGVVAPIAWLKDAASSRACASSRWGVGHGERSREQGTNNCGLASGATGSMGAVWAQGLHVPGWGSGVQQHHPRAYGRAHRLVVSQRQSVVEGAAPLGWWVHVLSGLTDSLVL